MLEGESQTFKEVMSTSNASYWKEAINNEIDFILSNHIWELIDLPSWNKQIGCKWIFKRKHKVKGSINKYKALVVAKGFRQR